MHKLFTELAQRYRHRQGGYTRVLQTQQRPNDAAQMAYIECVSHSLPISNCLSQTANRRIPCVNLYFRCTLLRPCL